MKVIHGEGPQLGEGANKQYHGLEAAAYLEALQEVRSVTLASFSRFSDQWLQEERKWGMGFRITSIIFGITSWRMKSIIGDRSAF